MADKLKAVGERIRKRRKELNMSQQELAEKVSICTSHMSDIENGKKNLGLETFIRITEELHVSADWLLRSDTVSTNAIVSGEIAELLSGCSADESQKLFQVLIAAKQLLFH